MQTKVLDALTLSLLLTLLGTAIYTDIRFGRIYNTLTFPAMAAGILLGAVSNGIAGLLDCLAGLGLVLVLYLVFAPRTGIGGGDIKLMMAVGALLGFELALWAMLYSAVAGGVLALTVMAGRRTVLSGTRNLLYSLWNGIGLRGKTDNSTVAMGVPFRYSPAIALGTVLAYFVRA